MKERSMQFPLAERLRPESWNEIIGQRHLVGSSGFITKIIQNGMPLSIILWGPAGTGKTSIARLYAQAFSMHFHSISPLFSGITELRKIIKEVEKKKEPLILFVDEIHRFNKAQQDAFLPLLEQGTIILVGATVENPSFYLNDALLSRTRVLKLHSLEKEELKQLIDRYEKKVGKLNVDKQGIDLIISLSHGDGRYLYNLLENLESMKLSNPISLEELTLALQSRSAIYDRAADQHYNLISALHKSIRGSDPDAALYWFSRMIEGGEDPLYIARRLIRVASEDIGEADPHSLVLCIAAKDAYQMLGSPEGELALAQIVVHLALAPKSVAIYQAFNSAKDAAFETSHLDPPSIILNAPTKLMKQMGYGKGYIYDPSTTEGFSGQNYFPTKMKSQEFYFPSNNGNEEEYKRLLEEYRKRRGKQ